MKCSNQLYGFFSDECSNVTQGQKKSIGYLFVHPAVITV